MSFYSLPTIEINNSSKLYTILKIVFLVAAFLVVTINVLSVSAIGENGTDGVVGPSGPNILHGKYYLESKWDSNGNLVQMPPRSLDSFTPEELQETFHLKNSSIYYDQNGKLDKVKLMNRYEIEPEPEGLTTNDTQLVSWILQQNTKLAYALPANTTDWDFALKYCDCELTDDNLEESEEIEDEKIHERESRDD